MRRPSLPLRGVLTTIADATEHTGFTLVLLVKALLHSVYPRNLRRAVGRVVEQYYIQIVKSLTVVCVVGLFTGMILALQTGETLQRYGAEGRLGGVVGATLAREMGPFITAIILAATVGAGIAAEIATMRVSEEIDALELMNIDPVDFLVAPRVAALGVAAVLLTVWVDLVGVVGGAIVAKSQFGITFERFFAGVRNLLADELLFDTFSKDIFSGLVKSYIFGLLIGALACAAGLRAHGGALGVGRAVRQSVVASVVLTLIVGYLITWVFWA